jgi:site-specific recombinase XerD
MLKQGASLSVVQELLGYRCLSSTEVYTKVLSADLIKMHKAFHSSEREKGIQLPELKISV